MNFCCGIDFMLGEQGLIFFGNIVGQRVYCTLEVQQASPFRFSHPFVGIVVAVEDNALVLPNGSPDQVVQGRVEIAGLFQNVCELGKLFRHNGVQHNIRPGNRGFGAQHTELEFVSGKGKGRGSVPIRGILGKPGQNMDADFHFSFVFLTVVGAVLNSFQDFGELVAQEHGNNSRRRFVGA